VTPERALADLVGRGVERLGIRGPATVVVAVSGGPDSIALLHGLVACVPDGELRLIVGHLDHGLRPDSHADADFVADAAARLGLECEIGAEDVMALARREHRSLEDAGRRARYRFLTRVAAEAGDASWIATGHTADDQAETILLRLIRGAGLRGLRGIPARRGRIVRPLLEERRAALRALLDAAGVRYLTDPTNADPASASRNRVRADLLPAMERLNPRAVEALGRFARLAADDDELLTALATAELARRTGQDGEVDWRDPPPRALGRRVVRLAVGEPAPDAGRIEAVLDAAEGPRGGLVIELGGRRSVEIRARRMRIG
jgi:tRNA(Ile)-lysidine synthase